MKKVKKSNWFLLFIRQLNERQKYQVRYNHSRIDYTELSDGSQWFTLIEQ